MRLRPWIVVGIWLVLAGCTGEAVEPTPVAEVTKTPTQVISLTPVLPTAQIEPSATIELALPTPADLLPTQKPSPVVCSPLEGIAVADLAGAVANPFLPPRLGSDDWHQGVDFAYRLDGDGFALAGEPVYAALGGRVVGVIEDRFPYGNALIIETPLNTLSDLEVEWPESPQTPKVSITLTCPDVEASLPDGEARSLYTIYAHMENLSSSQFGETVACGELLGATGDTGNALNPHLHVEMRVGPAGAKIDSMAHYETRASDIEMANYCLWRVSGAFVLVDPMEVWTAIGSP